MISQSTKELLDKVSELRAALPMDVLRIRQLRHSPRIVAEPVRDLGMRLRDIGQELMDHAEELDAPVAAPNHPGIPDLDR